MKSKGLAYSRMVNDVTKMTNCQKTSLLLAGIFLALITSGCAGTPEKTPAVHLTWPPPPQQTRIEFVRSISSEDSVGHDTTFTERVADFLGGEKARRGQLVQPMGVAVSDDGQRLYVSDFAQSAVYIFDFAKHEFRSIDQLQHPVGLALDADENLYIAEQQPQGVSVYSSGGEKLKFFTDQSLERPTGLAIDRKQGKLYVVDTGHTESTQHTVKVFDLDGKLLGHLGNNKGGAPGQFLFPTYVAVDKDSNIYVTDTLNSRVQKFDSAGNYLMSFGERGNGWGMFDKPKGVALDSFGNVYVVDSGWSNVQIFNPEGQVLLFFGGRGPLPGMLKNATAMAIDANNNIYVADYINHRIEQYRLVNTMAADSFPATAESPPDNSPISNSVGEMK